MPTWRDCDLRLWLSGAFFAPAFGGDERKLIQPTTCADKR
jgi:hypothetical protein